MTIILGMKFRLCTFLIIAMVLTLAVMAHGQEDKTVQPPKLLSEFNPVYPEAIKDAGIGGRVTVRTSIGESGEVLSVDQPSGPATLCNGDNNDSRLVTLRESAINAVRQAKFAPAMKDGKPVRMTVWVTVKFGQSAKPVRGMETPAVVAVGVVTGKAISLPKPVYPPQGRASRARGAVPVEVVIDETGKVFSAQAIAGHHLLRPPAVEAACMARFSETRIDGKAVRVSGVITYNFMP